MSERPRPPIVAARAGTVFLSTDTFTLMKVPPPEALRGLVHDIALYAERSGKPIRQLETASLVVPVLIGFADPFELAIGRLPTASDGFHSFTSGLTTKPVHIRSDGRCSCVEFTLTPLGARRFFGLPMSELTEHLVRIDDLADRSIESLRQRLGNEPDWGRRHAIAEAFLVERLRRAPPPKDPTAWAYATIVESKGQVPITALAERTGWSRKHLAQRFHAEIGLAPKAVARIARFENAQTLARRGNAPWAAIAADCGYADQAHMIRDFGEFAGTSPADWLASASPQ
jgi:AraC-like DNA-binding protein